MAAFFCAIKDCETVYCFIIQSFIHSDTVFDFAIFYFPIMLGIYRFSMIDPPIFLTYTEKEIVLYY